MDDQLPMGVGSGTDLVPRGNLLGPVIRRDIADLNRLFLRLSLDPGLEVDPRFAIADPVRAALAACDRDARERLALSPFGLFQIRLPQAARAEVASRDRVADARQPPPVDPSTVALCHSFVLLSLGVARSLAGGSPLSPRIALGVSGEGEARLAAMRPSELALLAAWPGLVRPRWPRHERFWGMLIAAAGRADGDLQRWAHCAGLCLIAAGSDAEEGLRPQGARARGRTPRGWPGQGLSC